MKPFVMFTAILAATFLGCRDYGVSPTNAQTPYPNLPAYNFYDYVAYDSLSSVAATGKLTLSIAHSRVSGSWNFDDGRSGRLKGTIDNGRMEIDLYPDSVAYDLTLTVEFPWALKGFSGEWKMDSLGVHNSGHFDATYKCSVILE